MILIINICKEKLHFNEFVKPVEEIIGKSSVKHYTSIDKKDMEADKIIICGTSLKDNQFLEDIEMFEWIKDFDKPILGICGGMQVFGGELGEKQEIGFYKEDFNKEFLGLKGDQEVYHLHNNYVTLPEDFVKYTESDIPQAIKHKTKPIYGVLFHPEVRNKELIENFIKL